MCILKKGPKALSYVVAQIFTSSDEVRQIKLGRNSKSNDGKRRWAGEEQMLKALLNTMGIAPEEEEEELPPPIISSI